MRLELDLELNPNPVVLPVGGSPPVAKPKARKRKPRFACPFQYGDDIQPDRDLIGGYLEECGRQQWCMAKNVLKSMTQFIRRKRIQIPPWQMGVWVHCRSEPRDLYRVVSTRFGWRVQHRVPSRGPWNTLGHFVLGMPVLFPTADAAIAAAEILIQAPTSKFGYLVWLKPGGSLWL
jgi:hypothetical protein